MYALCEKLFLRVSYHAASRYLCIRYVTGLRNHNLFRVVMGKNSGWHRPEVESFRVCLKRASCSMLSFDSPDSNAEAGLAASSCLNFPGQVKIQKARTRPREPPCSLATTPAEISSHETRTPRRLSALAVFDPRLYIRVRRIDEPAERCDVCGRSRSELHMTHELACAL